MLVSNQHAPRIFRPPRIPWEWIMSYSDVTSDISASAVVIMARGGTRRQRGAAIAAELRRWAPERLARVSTMYTDGPIYPGSSLINHYPATIIRYARNDSHLVPGQV